MFDSYDMKSLWFEFVNLLKTGNSTLRTCHFEASEKSKSQESNTEKGVLSRPLEIGILLHKQNIHAKHFVPECMYDLNFADLALLLFNYSKCDCIS